MVEQKGLNFYPEGTDNTPHRRTLNAELKPSDQGGEAGRLCGAGAPFRPLFPPVPSNSVPGKEDYLFTTTGGKILPRTTE